MLGRGGGHAGDGRRPHRRRRPSPGPARRWAAAWRQLVAELGVSPWRWLGLSAGAVAAGVSEASLLAVLATVAATVSRAGRTVELSLAGVRLDTELGTLFGVALGLALVRAALQAVLAYLPAAMSADAMATLRQRLFDAFTDAAWSVQSAERDGNVQALVSTHVAWASSGIVTGAQALSALFLFLTLLLAAVALNLPAALLLIVFSGALFALVRPLQRRTRGLAQELSDETTAYAATFHEVVRMAEETQVFGASESYRLQVQRRVHEVRRPLAQSRFLSGLVPVVYQSVAVIVLLLGLLIVDRLQVGRLAPVAAVVLLLLRSLTYGQQLQGAVSRLHEIAPFVARLQASMDGYRRQRRQDGPEPMPSVETFGLRGVRFAYVPGRPVLADVDLTVVAGEAVGIVGASGAGKSTLVQLLLRLREPDEGVVHVNGVDVRRLRMEDWQRRVAYVPQSPLLMWGTVADNIRYHRPHLDMEDVERAARLAGVHDVVRSWPQGYETVVGERVSAVSGGERQRLCLARAIAGRPDVIVLDEPTSALDRASERHIQHSLRVLAGETTLIVIAHRASTLAVCDRVLALVDGELRHVDRPDRLAEVRGSADGGGGAAEPC